MENPSSEEIDSYNQLQEAFSRASFLTHFVSDRQLYIEIDASKARGLGAMIYHLKPGSNPIGFKRTDVQPILFLSRLLTNAEQRYWPTELEMAGLVWVVRRIRHLIEGSRHPTVMFTDHALDPSIVKQTSLSSSNTDKLNLRLIRASTYLSQFRLDIRYKPGKDHIVPDALSRLPSNASSRAAPDILDISSYHSSVKDVSDSAYAFQGSLAVMSADFKNRVLEGYLKEKSWTKIKKMLEGLKERSDKENDNDSKTGIDFEIEDGLIYHKDRKRLCIPSSLDKEIFEMVHDQNQHSGVTRCYHRISESLFIPRLSRKLRTYIKHCPPCQLGQTKRHKPYGELMPIACPPIQFHTICMDFILGLPGEFDTLLTVTCKFSKRATIIVGKSTYKAKDWAKLLINRLQISDWGLPAAIISDRDPKFMSELWQTIFNLLGTKILTSTAYHPQSDGQSERTNQTVETAIRFVVTNMPHVGFKDTLPALQAQLNNSPNASTGLSPNETIYGFKVRESTSTLRPHLPPDVATTRLEFRQEAKDAISYANARMKVYYDARHVPLLLNPGDQAYLRLHKGYNLPAKPNRKLSDQRCGPFLVKKRVGRLAYELELLPRWRIHPTISVTQLEPFPEIRDPYNRPRPTYPDAAEVEGDTDEY